MTRILIIDDEPDMLGNLADAVTGSGFQACTARNGRDGIAQAHLSSPHLILCDVMMPDMDGLAVLAALRADKATAGIPFIFLTAKGERCDVRAGMNLGADDYLIKPVPLEDLMRAIQARIERRGPREGARGAPVFDSPEPLQALGISAREAEILFWTAQGKTNGDIGMILKVSPATVKKHLENIYRKTGTEHRTAASLRAMEVLGGATP